MRRKPRCGKLIIKRLLIGRRVIIRRNILGHVHFRPLLRSGIPDKDNSAAKTSRSFMKLEEYWIPQFSHELRAFLIFFYSLWARFCQGSSVLVTIPIFCDTHHFGILNFTNQADFSYVLALLLIMQVFDHDMRIQPPAAPLPRSNNSKSTKKITRVNRRRMNDHNTGKNNYLHEIFSG